MQRILSVSEVNSYIKSLMAEDMVLSCLSIKGEISNYKYHSSSHMYFTLKDKNGCILKCVMFRTRNMMLKFMPKDGLSVVAKGNISVFERDGQYQLYVEDMQQDGIGDLYAKIEQLKEKLRLEGVFDAAHKQKIPFLPDTIGVITSPTGSVIRDIINVSGRRFGNVKLKIYPVAVQGEDAKRQICRAISELNRLKCVDVIILARGGGSLEELWAFNEECVARSIYNSKIPLISAVGHETDYTIADFVADLRAPTPSAAAELAVPEKQLLKNRLDSLNTRLKRALQNRAFIDRTSLNNLHMRLYSGMDSTMKTARARFGMLTAKLDALSPLAVLARGYAITKTSKGEIITSIDHVRPKDGVCINLRDGDIHCIVEKLEREIRYGEVKEKV